MHSLSLGERVAPKATGEGPHPNLLPEGEGTNNQSMSLDLSSWLT